MRQDLNGDETVSAREYNGPPKMFKELDTDGDSKLSLEEARWMMTFSSIPSGRFMMGSETGGNDEKPVHEVKIDAFQMSTTEVTTAPMNSSPTARYSQACVVSFWTIPNSSPSSVT